MLLNCGVGDDSWESPGLQGDQSSQSKRKLVLNIHWKNQCWSWSSNTCPPDVKSWVIGKDPDTGKDWGQEEKGMTEDEMVGWHHWLNAHEFEQTLGDGEGQGSLACSRPWVGKESQAIQWLNNNRGRNNHSLVPLEIALAGGGTWTEHSAMSMVGALLLVGLRPPTGSSRRSTYWLYPSAPYYVNHTNTASLLVISLSSLYIFLLYHMGPISLMIINVVLQMLSKYQSS